jgi:methionine-R-sulfoxide reductase
MGFIVRFGFRNDFNSVYRECSSFLDFAPADVKRPFSVFLFLLERTCAATEGHFACRACNAPLYSAEAKFKSGCGWPAFDKCYKGAVATVTDSSFGMRRVEILCAACGGHLGHVFEGERMTPTNERHCVNSVSFSSGTQPVLPSLALSGRLTNF